MFRIKVRKYAYDDSTQYYEILHTKIYIYQVCDERAGLNITWIWSDTKQGSDQFHRPPHTDKLRRAWNTYPFKYHTELS